MLRLKIFVLLAFSCQVLSAQDLHIYYDAFTDSVYYMQGGKSISQPIARKGSNVMLHIQNFNNYLYDVSVQTQKGDVTVAQAQPFSLSNLLPGNNVKGLFMGSGSPIPGGLGLPGLDIPQGSGALSGEEEIKRQAAIAELQVIQEKLNTAYVEMKSLNSEISKIQKDVQTKMDAQKIQSFAASEIQNLRYNPNLEPRQIKQLSKEYLQTIFAENDPNDLTLSSVLAKSDAKGELTNLKTQYTQKVDALDKTVGTLQTYVTTISNPKFNFENSGIEDLRTQAGISTTAAAANLKTYKANISELDSKLAGVTSLDAQALAALRTTYLTVMENDFSKTYRQTASTDNLKLELVFTPIDSVKKKGVVKKTMTPIELNVYGGLRINASLGVGFGQFFERPLNYFVRDSVIGSSKKDAFNPYLTSFVHFYRQSRGDVSLGGSFGVGIPLGGENGLDNIAFFLGPSLVLGRGERIVLSAGILGGKVSKLNGGYAVGDTFGMDSSTLTKEASYELGYYVGISFNLIGG